MSLSLFACAARGIFLSDQCLIVLAEKELFRSAIENANRQYADVIIVKLFPIVIIVK